jgi:single-strand DNA-binding protein
MKSLNRVELIGNLGKDPEVREAGGGRVANLSVATSESWKDKSGDWQERTQWHRVTVWGKLADVAAQYLTKGSKVYVAGKLQSREWVDKEGNKRETFEVVLSGFDAQLIMLDAPSSGHASGERQARPAGVTGGGQPARKPLPVDLDEEIPF